ncbi:alkaline phosphatase-like [Vanessa cardui]|uniref:alkaline phosphatase-like n=1 Tax=Vanessa cardui TaxID=171605 RepID=UPI001F132522|nr:alkaline phosphatase-like [Vanessa cardui]
MLTLVALVSCIFLVSAGTVPEFKEFKAGKLRTDQQFWKNLARDELYEALRVRQNYGRAKNVILFIGDGMGPNTVTAARIYKGGEGNRLAFERFPHMGLLKTYSADQTVSDSSSTATALLCGVKVNRGTFGVDASVGFWDCPGSLRPEARLESLAAIALKAGKSAGVVTNMRITHSTPGPLYAHSAQRNWECDAKMPESVRACKDTARQLIEDFPGRDFNVILGGGRQAFLTDVTETPDDPIDSWGCVREDGRNLIEDYKLDKQRRGLRAAVVNNNLELNSLNLNNTDYLLGLFANTHLKYEHERDAGPNGTPSLSQLVEAAVTVLRRNEKGFFLMVEGGNISMAHFRGRAKKAIMETLAFEQAVLKAMAMTNEEETLIIVTSDHAFTLNINGYPRRGQSIFGIAMTSPHDHRNYTTLSYSVGGPGSFHYEIENGSNGIQQVVRRDPSTEDIEDENYEQIAAIPLDESGHGGSDVTVYARGPFSHLFHNIHEEHYVYTAVSYAAEIGDFVRPRQIN